MSKISLIIIEDHALTRIGLVTAFENAGFDISAEAENGEEGLKTILEHKPDIVVLDLGLPGIDGIEVLKQIKANTNSKVLVLTSHENEKEVLETVKLGVNAYCMKDISPKRLVSIAREVVQSGVWFEDNIIQLLRKNLRSASGAVNKERTPSPLTDREIEILQLLADGKSNNDIADEISVSQHTVKSHIGNILHKLSVNDRANAIVIAMRNGWVV